MSKHIEHVTCAIAICTGICLHEHVQQDLMVRYVFLYWARIIIDCNIYELLLNISRLFNSTTTK